MNKYNILYVSNSCFPNNASGIRVNNLGGLLKSNNYNVVYYSCNDYNAYIPDEYKNNLVFKHYDKYVEFEFDNDLHYFNKNNLNKLKNYVDFYFSNFTFENIIDICIRKNINTIILYNPRYSLAKKILTYCNKNNIKLIIDNTEWYELDKKKNYFDNYVAKSVNRRITQLDRKINKIISISPWMNNWYLTKGIKSICIMPLMRNFKEPIAKFNDDTINILYCGVPGTKDLLIPFVETIIRVNNPKIRLDIVGVKTDYFSYNNLNQYNIYCHGRIPHHEVEKYYENADFSCLFRNNQRYAKAGFSTKVAESLSYGVPVLCNKVGGTDDIIETNFNGIKIDSFNSDDIEKMIQEIMNLKKTDIYQMKINAYETAKKLFDMENYKEKVKDFMDLEE